MCIGPVEVDMMTKETKHTPTPWAWIEGDPDIFTHWNNKEVVLATVKHPVWHEDRLCGSMEAAANASHIVKCVNLHDELVDALLPFATEVLDNYDDDSYPDVCTPQAKDYRYAIYVLKKAGAL